MPAAPKSFPRAYDPQVFVSSLSPLLRSGIPAVMHMALAQLEVLDRTWDWPQSVKFLPGIKIPVISELI